MKYSVGIDFGRTIIKGAIIREDGKILRFKKRNSKSQKGRKIVFSNIQDMITDLLKIARKNKYQITGVGIGFPGPLNIKKGIILNPPNLPGWENVPIVKILSHKFNLPIFLNNDANCAVLGEQWRGVAQGLKNVCMLTLGSGIGGGLILDGKLYVGSDGLGAELGHMSIDKNGKKCGCGSIGCLETYISALSLIDKARRENLKVTNAKEIFLLSKKGNQKACEIVNEFIKNLGCGIANLVNIFNPEMVILGGGMIGSSDLILNNLKKEVQKRTFVVPFKNVKISIAKLGDKYAGVIGAAKLALA